MNTTGRTGRNISRLGALVAGLSVAAVAATAVNPSIAGAFPSKAKDCSACHDAGGTTTATASTVTARPGATYTVAVAMTANPSGGNSGYAIVPVAPATGSTYAGNTSAALKYTATMTAPSTPGTYTYTVFTNQGSTGADGHASSKQYTITVPDADAVTTTTTLAMASTATTAPAPAAKTLTATVSGAGAAGVVRFYNGTKWLGTRTLTAGKASLALTSIPVGTYSYKAAFTPTNPAKFYASTSTAKAFTVYTRAAIKALSPTYGRVGRVVTITGTNFATKGGVKFGNVAATVRTWTATKITVVVPKPVWPSASSKSVSVLVKVTPKGRVASAGKYFKVTR